MNKQSVALKELKIGMFVELPLSWISHDFLKSKFLITSDKQLQKIRQLKMEQVIVNFERSLIQSEKTDNDSDKDQRSSIDADIDTGTVIDPRLQSAPENWDPQKLVTDDLRNILDNRSLSPEQKSTFVYHHSVDMMKHLLECPTAENIQVCRETVYHISEMVLAENDTAMNLLRITSHDYSTYTHSVDVGIISIILSKVLLKHSDGHNLNELAAGFFLHDLGKVEIDHNILNKPGKLTDAEMQLVQSHPHQGYKILQKAKALSEECGIIVMQHHEAIDGSGYPQGLKGDDIHLYGKICAIVDVYTALTAERSYKQALSTFQALKLMKDSMLNRFDWELLTSFVKIFHGNSG
jgi:HD-GYP domain-containing protein (c-di-GMP phosphodiesterase class II)